MIEYKGQTLDTIYYEKVDDDVREKLKNEYYKLPDFELVKRQLINIKNGGSKINHITNYYFKDLISKVQLYHSKWSIEDVFNCNDLIGYFIAKTKTNEKIYPSNTPLIKNIETSFRLGGKGVACKPSNYPISSADHIYEKYNINNKVYDFSCGWGVRLMSAMKHNIDYYGTDPNYLLCERLDTLKKDYQQVNDCKINATIYQQGSEIFITELENTIGLAFSSPPYFILEDYKIGNQSCDRNTPFDKWISNYLVPTINNIYKYLITGGILAININNFDKYDLVGNVMNICKNIGLEYVTTEKLVNIKRTNSNGSFNDNSEGIYIFKKL